VKKFSDFAQSLFVRAVHFGADMMKPVFTDLGLLFNMPFPVEAVSPEWARV